MKKILIIAISITLLLFGSYKVYASTMADSLSGRILLQVQSNGEAWYVNPNNNQRYYMGRPDDAFSLMRSLGLGIKNSELSSYLNSSFPSRLSGKILLDVEKNGEAYYVYPVNLKGYYLGRPADAFSVMKNLGLGITNANLNLITIALGGSGLTGNVVTGEQNNSVTPITYSDVSSYSGNSIVGAPTASSVTINTLVEKGAVVIVEYGVRSGLYNFKSDVKTSITGEPVIIEIDNLQSSTKYYYRVNYKLANSANYVIGSEHSFYTQRSAGSTFSFGVQGDSHPERAGKMFNPELYYSTMANVASSQPDFYFTLGDDFSIENLIDKNEVTQTNVNSAYLNQRNYLSVVGASSPLFLVNGNHEQAAKYLLNGTASSPAVMAANARVNYFPLPYPGSFYGGDSEQVANVGYLRDYYSFEWGDALFVSLDPYWHSDVAVDNVAGGGSKRSNLWDITLGDAQYQWFKETLENSQAKYKFVFTHHVLGTGRGGIENAKLYEWGGYNQQGIWEFDKMRPAWEMPIHQLMVKNGVTIFFQGHDHVFAKQELDGIIYQEVPNPADDTYTAFNKDAYKMGDVLANSGFLNISVEPNRVKVDYVKSYLPEDETSQNKNNTIGYSYIVE